MPSGANSHSGSLGASISDLSSEATSEFSDNFIIGQNNQKSNTSTKTPNSNGMNTPTKGTNSMNGTSRLPVLKKK